MHATSKWQSENMFFYQKKSVRLGRGEVLIYFDLLKVSTGETASNMNRLALIVLISLSGFCLQAQPNLDSLYGIWRDETLPERQRIVAYYDFIWEGYLFSNPDTAFILAEELADFARQRQNISVEGQANYIQGVSFALKSNYDQALVYLKRSLKIQEKLQNKVNIAGALNNIGNIYQDKGDYEKSLEYFKRSLIIQKEIDNKAGIGNALNNIGITYKYQGNYFQAIQYYQESLIIKEEIGDKIGTANTYNNIGNIYKDQDNYSKALSYYKNALEIQYEIGNKLGIANSLNNIGLLYGSKGENDQALVNLKNSLEIRKELKDQHGIAQSLYSIGKIYRAKGEYQIALTYLQPSLEIRKTIGNQHGVVETMSEIGLVYLSQNQYQQAISACQQSLNLSREIGGMDFQQPACDCLYRAHKALANTDEALKYLEKLIMLKDSLNKESTEKKLQEMEFERKRLKLEAEKDLLIQKNRTQEQAAKAQTYLITGILAILLLSITLSIIFYRQKQLKTQSNQKIRALNTEIQQQSEEIQAQNTQLEKQKNTLQDLNAVKDQVFSIIAHDLRSPINSLQGLLSILHPSLGLSPAENEQLLERVASSVHAITGLLNNLLYWGKSQMQGQSALNPEKLEIQPFVAEVIALLAETAKPKKLQITTKINPNGISVWSDPEVLRLILRNLLNNAYKYSYTAGEVIISAAMQGDQVKISVADQGTGMDEVTREALFKGFVKSQQGTEAEKGTGLGLMLCHEYVIRSGGQIGVESKLKNGSVFWFTLPKA